MGASEESPHTLQSLSDLDGGEQSEQAQCTPKFRMQDFFGEMMGTQKVTTDPKFQCACAVIKDHAAAARELARAVSKRTAALVALTKSSAKVKSAATTLEPGAAAALAPWATAPTAGSDEADEPERDGGDAAKGGAEEASRAVVSAVLDYAKDLDALRVKVTKARSKARADMDHYAAKVPSLEKAVAAAAKEKERRAARYEAKAAAAKKDGKPVPETTHLFYESTDAQQSDAHRGTVERLARNKDKLDAAVETYDAANAAAISALTAAVEDSLAETVPIVSLLLAYEQALVALVAQPTAALAAAAAAVAALGDPPAPARAEADPSAYTSFAREG